MKVRVRIEFLYSQDLSNYKTSRGKCIEIQMFLYSQDLSNYKTLKENNIKLESFCILKI